MDHGSRGRWNRGSAGRRDAPDNEKTIINNMTLASAKMIGHPPVPKNPKSRCDVTAVLALIQKDLTN